jgi:hypothetical protein
MKKISLYLLLLLILSSCNNNTLTLEDAPLRSSEVVEIDTVLEKNTPDKLNMNHHQLFIDTTSIRPRTATSPLNYKKNPSTIAAVEDIIQELIKIAPATSIKLTAGFPTKFVPIHPHQGSFILYDRCDGIDPQYKIEKDKILQFGPLELSAYTIAQVITQTATTLHLQLNALSSQPEAAKIDFKITKTDNPYIFKLLENNRTTYLTPLHHANQFDILVNHCPNQKVVEYTNWD